jgi:hypothetical protein
MSMIGPAQLGSFHGRLFRSHVAGKESPMLLLGPGRVGKAPATLLLLSSLPAPHAPYTYYGSYWGGSYVVHRAYPTYRYYGMRHYRSRHKTRH